MGKKYEKIKWLNYDNIKQCCRKIQLLSLKIIYDVMGSIVVKLENIKLVFFQLLQKFPIDL